MRRHFVLMVTITLLVTHSVYCDENIKDNNSSVDEKSVEIKENSNSVKTKRGIYGHGGLSYSIPAYHTHQR